MPSRKEKRSLAVIGLIVAAAIMSALAFAQSATMSKTDGAASDKASGVGPHVLTFADLDTDADGLITIAEVNAFWDANRRKKFDRYDSDGDGKISREEWQRWQSINTMYYPSRDGASIKSVTWEDLDRDKNGSITFEEYKKYWSVDRPRVFKRFDANGDGKVSREEWVVWEKTAPMQK